MATEDQLREGLAANLADVGGLHEHAYVLSNPTLPAAEIVPGPIDYDKAMGRGTDEWTFIVRVLVGTVSDVGAQKLLGRMRASSGADSIKAALESDRTLAGAARDLIVRRCSGQQTYGEGRALGAEWTVSVFAAGT